MASTSADPNAIYVVEQGGRVRRVVNGITDAKPFLNISKNVRTSGEQGLLSIAFSPSYATDHTFYAFYVSRKRFVTISQFVSRRKNQGEGRKDGDGGGKGGGSSELVQGDRSADRRPLAVRQPQRRRSWPSGPTGSCTRRSVTAAAAAIPCTAGRPRSRTSASCCGPPGRRSRPGRSRATACGTRGGTRSTARPATSTSATSARETARRSTTARPPTSRRRRTTAGTATKAPRTTTRAPSSTRRTRPPRRSSSRSRSTTTRTATARSSAATSTAAARWRTRSGATSTPISARAGSGAWPRAAATTGSRP